MTQLFLARNPMISPLVPTKVDIEFALESGGKGAELSTALLSITPNRNLGQHHY